MDRPFCNAFLGVTIHLMRQTHEAELNFINRKLIRLIRKNKTAWRKSEIISKAEQVVRI